MFSSVLDSRIRAVVGHSENSSSAPVDVQNLLADPAWGNKSLDYGNKIYLFTMLMIFALFVCPNRNQAPT